MDKYIIFAGRKVPIASNYPVLLYENDAAPSFYHPEKTLSADKLMQMALLRPTMKTYSFRSGHTRTPEQLFGITRPEIDDLGQKIWQIALHHDVTTNAVDTYNVLCSRGLSTHFVVNYDGSLYQFMDCYHTAWATGDNNAMSIAIDMNNPVYPELRDEDPAAGMREIYQGKINGSVKTMLGYTEPQYETIIALIKALITPIQIPGEADWIPLPRVSANCFPPISENGEVINRLMRDSTRFEGFLGHYHCSANKWDPGPAFDWLRVLSGIKGKRNSLPILLGEPGDQRNLDSAGGQILDALFEQYYSNIETSSGGWYPIGTNQSWHSGVHISAPKGTPVLNMMEGTIVAVRNVKTVDLGDPSFVLVRHEREEQGDDGKPVKVYWYSLYMHLQPMFKEEEFARIPWVSDLMGVDIQAPDKVIYNMNAAASNYEKGIPQVVDGRVKSKNPDEILEAFFKGDIILTDLKCVAGTPIGTVGKFGEVPDRLSRQIHVEVFSAENIFSRGNAQSEAWSIIEGDSTDYSLVRVKKLLKPIQEHAQAQAQTGKLPTFLKSTEISAFFSMSDRDYLAPRRNDFRKMICYHRSEWSPMMNWTKTAVQSVGWQWESEHSFGKWLVLWLPFQWLTKDLTSALELPSKHFFFTYHPIYMLQQLNQTYIGDMGTQRAEEASDAELQDNAEEMARRVARLTELNKKYAENKDAFTDAEREERDSLYMLMDDHLDDSRADISAETKYEYYYDEDFEKWEPGEWQPPKKVKLSEV